MRNEEFKKKVAGMVKWFLPFCLFTFLPLSVVAQEQLVVADAFQFSVRTDYTADGSNMLSRPYQSRFGIEGWSDHMALALVLTTDMEQASVTGQSYKAAPESAAAATPAQPVVYMASQEGYQNVTFFSSDKQYVYVLYFVPESQRSWLLVSRVGGGTIQPLYQLSNDTSLLTESQTTAELYAQSAQNKHENVDAFVSLTGRLASGQYHGINYIEK